MNDPGDRYDIEPLVNSIYRERNQLVAALSKLFPASLEPHVGAGVADWVVRIDLPTGQAGWHIPTGQLWIFDHLPRSQGRAWDGHTNEEKYDRLSRI